MTLLPRAACVVALLLAMTASAFAASGDHGLAQWSIGALTQAKARIETLAGDLAQAPAELRRLNGQTRASLMSGTGVRGFTYLLIMLLAGSAAEWLYWTYAYAPLRAIQSASVQSPRQALRVGLRRLLLAGSGLMLFTVATIGASAAFSWPPGVQELVVAATLLVLVLRLAWVVVAIVLAPGRPPLRLVPVAPERARWLAALAMTVVCLLALGRFVPDLIERISGARHAAGAFRFIAATAAALLLLVVSFMFFGRAVRGAGAARMPRFPRSFLLALLVAAVYGIWLLATAAATIAAIAAVVVALQIGLRDMVFFFWQSDAASATGPKDKTEPEFDPVLPSIVLSAARFMVVLLGLGACAIALDTPAAELAMSESPMARLGLRVLGVATLALLTHAVWITVRTAIDQRLSRIEPGDAHEGPNASARLLTLLPLLRVTASVFLVVMLVLSSLWALGIEITPLLAGAGVVGLALGFGAQALVRDVIAGIFFLAEDAFRIGEYIESGTSTKGTVERITLRTVALRHHNGPLHFVPYGALGTVRNNSRDWVIEKFNLPLPIDVDSEKIRKLIKKVGEDMMADPEVGPLMLQPLKGKLQSIDPGVKIFRCKFQTAPGKQFDVRAQALKRIEDALKAMGVGFAQGR
ncbi:MAG: mechanosensitive ion channel family protein [Betaproteobacteria bacterium]|nr:mechanosensitive ion channel family protein [Betaproteobacteria bacterium]